MSNIIIDGNIPSQIIPEQWSINDTVATNYTTYSSEKIEALDGFKMDKEVSGAIWEILIKDAFGNAQASWFKTDDFALSSHNHDASEMVLSTVNFGWVLDETIDTAQKLADWIDDTWLHQAEITAEIAQDAVGNILTDTDSINFTYNDSLWQITADVKPDATQTFTNKTITDYTNTVYAEALTFHIKATGTINKWQPVRVTGYNSGEDAFEVVLANQATWVANGVALQNLTIGQFGLMLSDGVIEGIDTSTFSEWIILYLDGTGAFQTTVPVTWYIQQLAYVLRSHAVNGALQIKAQSPLQRVGDIPWLQTTLDWKANDISVIHKTWDETFEWVKISKNDFHVGQQVANVPTGLRAVSQSLWAKNNINAGWVHFSTIVDADGIAIGPRKMAIWGYPHKTADGSIWGHEEFMAFSFPTYDGNTTYSKKIETNVGTITFKSIALIEYGTEWNMGLFYWPRLTLWSSHVDFWYRFRDSNWQELFRIRTANNDVAVWRNMKMAKDYQSDAGGNWGYFSIASRYERSNIPHESQWHILQVGWDAINSEPEGSGNDGGWWLMFWAYWNPYIFLIWDTSQFWRSGGITAIRWQVLLDELRVTKCRDITGTNLNDVLVGWEYNTNGTTALNSPINDYIFLKVMVYSWNNAYITQEATMLASGATPVRKWIRKREAWTWYGWREFNLT